ncbi:MBL fold metallo-hydrolase [Nocardioides ganghwensis]|jgi:glyoxylase-like metal-dependent hydrolase (beta-lactamase superfamily II)|uniref:MBL fold metallo-hydrolase n=1 Tax=Nocardioides ganghwensis TaxID=252230 RepID=A0A4Q2SE52_9ACTN|nr:MBL fold metallo-hydrolase [Nocardioides ganghwensis]MBD3946619.1 MBL fold metallo-hydrolase [Nocardioides ganghwensis]RYC03021.1 MBL fold metallo-hydrolase [Nocardioides ganghwensis]
MVTDTYTGDVSPGGDPDVRRLGCLTLTKVAVDPEMSNNCYVLHCSDTDEVVLVDAAAEPERLLELIGDRTLTSVVTTHQHWDHHRGLAAVTAAHPGAVVVAGAPDADAIEEQTGVTVGRRVGEGDTVPVGTCELAVIPVAGHTPGSICLVLDDEKVSPTPHLFTGDCLFPGGVGATFGDVDKFSQLVGEVEHKLFGRLPDETWFYPGHGNDGVLGDERPHLAEWRERGW